MNKKGTLTGTIDNIQLIFVIVLVLALIIGLIYGLATAGPLISGELSGAATDIKTSVYQSDPDTDLYNATTVSTDLVSGVTGKMELLVYAIFFGLFIGFIVVAYEVKFYPWLSFAWVGLMFVIVIFSIVLSNAYMEQKAEGTTLAFYASWGTTGWVMEYLPQIMGALGLLSGVLLFIISTKSPEEEMTTGTVNL